MPGPSAPNTDAGCASLRFLTTPDHQARPDPRRALPVKRGLTLAAARRGPPSRARRSGAAIGAARPRNAPAATQLGLITADSKLRVRTSAVRALRARPYPGPHSLPAVTMAVSCCAPAAPTPALRGHAGGKPPGPPPRSAQHLVRHGTSPRTRAHHRITHTQPSRRRRPQRPQATETLCQLPRRGSSVLMTTVRRPAATVPHRLLARVGRLTERLRGRAGRHDRRRRSGTQHELTCTIPSASLPVR